MFFLSKNFIQFFFCVWLNLLDAVRNGKVTVILWPKLIFRTIKLRLHVPWGKVIVKFTPSKDWGLVLVNIFWRFSYGLSLTEIVMMSFIASWVFLTKIFLPHFHFFYLIIQAFLFSQESLFSFIQLLLFTPKLPLFLFKRLYHFVYFPFFFLGKNPTTF